MFNEIKTIEDVINDIKNELKVLKIEIDEKNKLYNKLFLYQTYLENIKNGRS